MEGRRRLVGALLVMIALVAFTWCEASASLLVSEASGSEKSYGYNGTQWPNMTAALNTATGGAITMVSNFENLAQMLSYDALWLDQRSTTGSLSATEVANIASFIATGKRVVMIGENDNWQAWNQQITGIGGGTYNYMGFWLYETAMPVLVHELTDGVVNGVYLPAAGVAVGGTPLFDYNFATLWGSSSNVLTILDVNIFSNQYWGYASNSIFATNVAEWIATPIPVPGAVWLLGSGLLGLAGWRRCRKN